MTLIIVGTPKRDTYRFVCSSGSRRAGITVLLLNDIAVSVFYWYFDFETGNWGWRESYYGWEDLDSLLDMAAAELSRFSAEECVEEVESF